MSIFRRDEPGVVSILFEIAAWIVVALVWIAGVRALGWLPL